MGRTHVVKMDIVGKPWMHLAGAVVQCRGTDITASTQIIWQDSTSNQFYEPFESKWCLLLVGSDGQFLPVALVPLPNGLGSLPLPNSRVRPRFSAPLPARLFGRCTPDRPGRQKCQHSG